MPDAELNDLKRAAGRQSYHGWPLRNGDFSRDEFTRQTVRPDWHCHLPPGVTVRREDSESWDPIIKGDDGDELWRPGTVTLQADQASRTDLWQDVRLPPGDYAFRVEARTTPDALLTISAAGSEATYSGANWSETTMDFSVKDGGLVRVQLASQRLGEVQLRDVRIDVRRVSSAAVGLADGRTLGALVLPEGATEAEQYAAWELQKHIFRMTGKTPGVTGRDESAEGVRIRIGRAAGEATLVRLDGLADDSYIVVYRKDDILLAGNNDRGTLYAAYDFLKQQGCGWYWPGPSGEVVPQRETLQMAEGTRVESPDWLLRGMDNKRPDWDASGWRDINVDDYIDWLVRNRQNALLASGALTIDFGKWRGGSYVLRTNHSLNRFWLKAATPAKAARAFWWENATPIKEEWAPLVAGVRKPFFPAGRPNMACTSNRELRDRTVHIISEFFRQRPEATIFGLNADDEPASWCECPNCRAQDADKGTGAWHSEGGEPPLPMTDRWLNYVNEVAARVAEVYPDRLIETYIYASTRPVPERERVHPNVMVRFCFYPGLSPYGKPLRNHSCKANAELHRLLAGWRQAGAQNMCLYDYDNHRYEDSVFTWFYRMTDSMRTFNSDWAFRHYLAEQHNLISAASYMMYNVRARLLWDSTTDYLSVIREVCAQLHGPVADTVYEYYRHMDQVVLDYWQKHFGSTSITGHELLALKEYSFADMEAGQALLDKAWEAAGDDATLRSRLARLRFGHAMSTLVLAMTAHIVEERELTREDEQQAQAAWQLARDLRTEYDILGSIRLNHHLESFYVVPRIGRELFAFPIAWQFKKDPKDQGLKEKWCQAIPDSSWVDIRTDDFWTGQGHEYHGVAWYSVEFSLPEEIRAALRKAAEAEAGAAVLTTGGPAPALHFGGVDGFADIFLDGKKIGEQEKDPSEMWRKPFAIRLSREVSQAFAREGKHRLAVRVKKESHGAGIWKPVRIVILAD